MPGGQAVGGYPGAAPYIRLLKAWEIPWVFVVDGEHLRDVLKQLRKHLGLHYDKARINRFPFEKAKEEAEKHGIFTLNTDDEGKFETLPFVKENIEKAPEEYRSSKPLQGRWVALQTSPPEVKEVPPEVKEMCGKIRKFFKSAGSPGPAAGQPG